MHKLCIIDNIWSGHFPPNVFGFGINFKYMMHNHDFIDRTKFDSDSELEFRINPPAA